MSRALQTSSKRLRISSTGLGLAALLWVAGCGVGQVTQTDSMKSGVNGTSGQVGPIAIRDARFAFPRGGGYPAGGEASLVLTIINTGSTDDELVKVSSTLSEDPEITGDRSLPARRAIAVGTPDEEVSPRESSSVVVTTATPSTSGSTSGSSSAPGSASSVGPTSSSGPGSSSVAPGSSSVAPTSLAAAEPVVVGKATIVLKGLASALVPGRTYPVTFVFRDAGSITLELPIAAPTSARPEPTEPSGPTGGHG